MDPRAAPFVPMDTAAIASRRPRETAEHKRKRKERQRARLVVGVAQARDLWSKHHSRNSAYELSPDEASPQAKDAQPPSTVANIIALIQHDSQTLEALQQTLEMMVVHTQGGFQHMYATIGNLNDQCGKSFAAIGTFCANTKKHDKPFRMCTQSKIAAAVWEPLPATRDGNQLVSSVADQAREMKIEGEAVISPLQAVHQSIGGTSLRQTEMSAGTIVKFIGLVGAAHLNGQTALVQSFDLPKDRYIVRMRDGKSSLRKAGKLVEESSGSMGPSFSASSPSRALSSTHSSSTPQAEKKQRRGTPIDYEAFFASQTFQGLSTEYQEEDSCIAKLDKSDGPVGKKG